MGKELTLIGVIDDSGYELENRVYSRGGCSIALCSHIQVDKPMVVKKWKRKRL